MYNKAKSYIGKYSFYGSAKNFCSHNFVLTNKESSAIWADDKMYSDDYFSMEITLLTVPGNTYYKDFCMFSSGFFFNISYNYGFAIMLRTKPGYLSNISNSNSIGLGYEYMNNGVAIVLNFDNNLFRYSDTSMSIKDCFIINCTAYENQYSSKTSLKNYVRNLIYIFLNYISILSILKKNMKQLNWYTLSLNYVHIINQVLKIIILAKFVKILI